MDKKKVLIALIVIGLLLSCFTVIAGAYYVGSSESNVYHYPSCYHVDKIKPDHLIRFDTVEEACNAGYRPCKDCRPPIRTQWSSEDTDNAAACIITVDDDGGADSIMIQDAINNAKDGDTIIVYSGIYDENVVVDKSVTLKGNGQPVVDANGSDSAITLAAAGITLVGFTATNSGSSWKGTNAGIKVTSNNNIITGNNASNNHGDGVSLLRSSNNTITGNNVSNNAKGIYLYDSSNNTIAGNIVSNNTRYGIHLYTSRSNIITDNTLSNNNDYGIYLCSSRNNTVTGNVFINDGLRVSYTYQNTVEDNIVNGKPLVYLEDASDYRVEDAGQVILVKCNNITIENLDLSNTSGGIELWKTENSIIANNTVSNNDYGIDLGYSSNNNRITGNNVSNNNRDGISLSSSSNNNITGNHIWNNNNGISLYTSSNNNRITGNNVNNNHWDGITLYYSSSNSIYLNNFINHTCSMYPQGSTSIWNSPFEITYAYLGATYESYLGNYWSDYEEKYPDAEEIDSTGIWDTPYSIDDEEDIYPLVMPIENFGKVPKTKITPINITEANLSCDNETLRIGAFNIQVFGKSKAAKGEVMEVLADIIRTYDIVAIQEIRDKSQTAFPQLVDLVNSKGVHYDYVVGPRLGRSSSKEQYSFVYNNQTVNLNGTPWTYPEPNGTDPFHREPYIAAFRAVNGSFDATFLVIHVDPDEATEEIYALDAVVNYTKGEYPDEQDFIILGDLNADCSYFDEDSNCSICGDDYYWCINNSVDTTTSATNCTYDRIIITNPAVPDYTGISGVFRYDLTYNLTEGETMAVSDHYPIYAEFYCDGDIDTPVLIREGEVSPEVDMMGISAFYAKIKAEDAPINTFCDEVTHEGICECSGTGEDDEGRWCKNAGTTEVLEPMAVTPPLIVPLSGDWHPDKPSSFESECGEYPTPDSTMEYIKEWWSRAIELAFKKFEICVGSYEESKSFIPSVISQIQDWDEVIVSTQEDDDYDTPYPRRVYFPLDPALTGGTMRVDDNKKVEVVLLTKGPDGRFGQPQTRIGPFRYLEKDWSIGRPPALLYRDWNIDGTGLGGAVELEYWEDSNPPEKSDITFTKFYPEYTTTELPRAMLEQAFDKLPFMNEDTYATPIPSPTTHIDIVINEVEANPTGKDTGNEWVELYNPTSEAVDLSGWILKTTHGRIGKVYPSGTIEAKGYRVFGKGSQWLDNEGDSVILRDNGGAKIDEVAFTDTENDDRTWQRYPNGKDTWKFRSSTKGSSNGG